MAITTKRMTYRMLSQERDFWFFNQSLWGQTVALATPASRTNTGSNRIRLSAPAPRQLVFRVEAAGGFPASPQKTATVAQGQTLSNYFEIYDRSALYVPMTPADGEFTFEVLTYSGSVWAGPFASTRYGQTWIVMAYPSVGFTVSPGGPLNWGFPINVAVQIADDTVANQFVTVIGRDAAGGAAAATLRMVGYHVSGENPNGYTADPGWFANCGEDVYCASDTPDGLLWSSVEMITLPGKWRLDGVHAGVWLRINSVATAPEGAAGLPVGVTLRSDNAGLVSLKSGTIAEVVSPNQRDTYYASIGADGRPRVYVPQLEASTNGGEPYVPAYLDIDYPVVSTDAGTTPVVLTAEKLSKTLRSPTVATFPDPATVVPMRDWYGVAAKLWNVRFPTVTEDPGGAGATVEVYLSKALTGTGDAPTATIYGYAGGQFVKEVVSLAGRTKVRSTTSWTRVSGVQLVDAGRVPIGTKLYLRSDPVGSLGPAIPWENGAAYWRMDGNYNAKPNRTTTPRSWRATGSVANAGKAVGFWYNDAAGAPRAQVNQIGGNGESNMGALAGLLLTEVTLPATWTGVLTLSYGDAIGLSYKLADQTAVSMVLCNKVQLTIDRTQVARTGTSCSVFTSADRVDKNVVRHAGFATLASQKAQISYTR